MRKWFVMLVLFSMLAFPAAARAQGEVSLSLVRVQLWPEYDQPSMLVIYDFVLSPDSPLPVDLNLRIPATSDLNVIAVGPTLETVSDQDVQYEMQVANGWLNVSTTLGEGMQAVRLEYYDSALAKAGIQRHYAYQWPGDYAVATFLLRFQHPLNSAETRTEPALAGERTGEDGLTYSEGEFGPLTVGQSFNLIIEYQKASDTLTIASLDTQTTGATGTEATSQFSLYDYLPWIGGGLGVVLVVIALVWGLNPRRENRRGMRKRRRHKPGRQENGIARTIFCSQCGERAQSGDAFCRHCGTRLQRDR